MDLGVLRTAWITESGRYDLVKTVGADNFVDNGANSVINDAVRWLDQQVESPDRLARFVETGFQAGDWFMKMAYAREITDVWATDSTGKRWQLKPVDFLRMRMLYTEDFDNISTGMVQYWTKARGRLSPDNKATDFTGAKDVGDTFRGASADVGYQGLVLMPPTDVDVIVTVFGRFWSPTLILDTDFNWWTTTHPRLVRWVCSYLKEVDHRNRTGQADWLDPIQRALVEIDLDLAEEESENIKGFIEA